MGEEKKLSKPKTQNKVSNVFILKKKKIEINKKEQLEISEQFLKQKNKNKREIRKKRRN